MSGTKKIVCAGMALLVSVGPGCSRRVAEVIPTYDEEARRYAAALCGAAFECNCMSAPFMGSVEECSAAYAANFQAILQPGDKIDYDCLSAFEDALANDPCLANGYDICPIVVNDLEEGSPCLGNYVPMFPIDQCAEGLGCLNGTCVSGHPDNSMGCYSGTLVSCDDVFSYCGVDGNCHEKGMGVGDACEPGTCRSDLYCHGFSLNQPGSCADPIAPGDACDPADAEDACLDNLPDDDRWCEPGTGECESGNPWLCAKLGHPDNWRAAILNHGT
jgi:hypothetical protein